MVRRKHALLAVLEEQSRQSESGINNPQALAKVYEDASLACQFEAHVVGLRDEDEIRQQRQQEEARQIRPTAKTLSPKKKKAAKRPLNIDGKSTECLRRRSRRQKARASQAKH